MCFQCHRLQRRNTYPNTHIAIEPSTAVSWQHGADLNVLAIQLLASLHLSIQGGRVEYIEWSDEDTLKTVATTKAVMTNHTKAVWAQLKSSLRYSAVESANYPSFPQSHKLKR